MGSIFGSRQTVGWLFRSLGWSVLGVGVLVLMQAGAWLATNGGWLGFAVGLWLMVAPVVGVVILVVTQIPRLVAYAAKLMEEIDNA